MKVLRIAGITALLVLCNHQIGTTKIELTGCNTVFQYPASGSGSCVLLDLSRREARMRKR